MSQQTDVVTPFACSEEIKMSSAPPGASVAACFGTLTYKRYHYLNA